MWCHVGDIEIDRLTRAYATGAQSHEIEERPKDEESYAMDEQIGYRPQLSVGDNRCSADAALGAYIYII
jgi:hypothetical protein